MSEEEYCNRLETFLARLKKTSQEIEQIEEDTRGQAGNPLLFQERSNRITASK
jgi:chaperonin cofactor prefoldin